MAAAAAGCCQVERKPPFFRAAYVGWPVVLTLVEEPRSVGVAPPPAPEPPEPAQGVVRGGGVLCGARKLGLGRVRPLWSLDLSNPCSGAFLF